MSSLELVCKLNLCDPDNKLDRAKFMVYELFKQERKEYKNNIYINLRRRALIDITHIYTSVFMDTLTRSQYHSFIDFVYDVTDDYDETPFNSKTEPREIFHSVINRKYDKRTKYEVEKSIVNQINAISKTMIGD